MRGLPGPLTNNWQLKLSAFAIAVVLWFVVQGDKPYTHRMSLPVLVANHDAEWVLTREPSPSHVAVRFSGSYRDLIALRNANPSIIVPVEAVRDSVQTRLLQRARVDVGSVEGSVAINDFRPDSVRLAFDRIATRLVALRPHFNGDVPSGYELEGPPIIEPVMVRASGPARRLAKMDSINLPPINVSGVRAIDTFDLVIDTTTLHASISPRRVRVILPMRPKGSALVPVDSLP
jgi:YbbR domain-containing protein